MDVLFCAHDSNTRLEHASETIDLSFKSYFSRFLEIEEPAFMPLGPKDSDTTSGGVRGNNSPGHITEPQDEDPIESQRQGESAPTDTVPEWLQAYAGHLSGDIGSDDEQNPAGESPRSSVAHVEPPPQTTSTMAQATPLLTADKGQGQGTINMELGGSEESPVHNAGVILTAMSDRTPNVALQIQEQQPQPPGEPHPGYDQGSITADANDAFPGLFNQMPTFPEFAGLSPEMPIFPGLGSAVGDEDMLSNTFYHSILQ